jgi:hypothetical protein
MKYLPGQIREKEKEIWVLYVAIWSLRIEDSKLFEEQALSGIRETCIY